MQTFLAPFRALGLGLVLGLGVTACQSSEPTTAPLARHTPEAGQLTLEREGEGPYLEGATERFRVVWPSADIANVRWSATAGKLETSGEQATWTLPASGTASLTATVVTASGHEDSGTWNFRVATTTSASAGSPGTTAGLIAAPVAVDSTSDTTGSACDLAFDSGGTGHIIYRNDTHPGLWYGTWNGTTWTTQLVDGPGFNVGGIVGDQMALAVSATGTPHIVYELGGRGIWYATRTSAGTWVRERVDATGNAPRSDTYVAIALDPAASGRPTLAWTTTVRINSLDYWRTAIAFRTAPDTWTRTVPTFPETSHYPLSGDIVFDSAGTLYVPYDSNRIGSWRNGATTEQVYTGYYGNARSSMVLAGANNRLVLRGPYGIFDVALTSPLAASTTRSSPVEEGNDVNTGDLAWHSGKPIIVHRHGSNLELVTPGAGNYWTYTQLGSLSFSSPVALAIRPTTGQPHICYQYNSKVMFQ